MQGATPGLDNVDARNRLNNAVNLVFIANSIDKFALHSIAIHMAHTTEEKNRFVMHSLVIMVCYHGRLSWIAIVDCYHEERADDNNAKHPFLTRRFALDTTRLILSSQCR